MSAQFDVVTGAFSYTGKAIAARLLEEGRTVRTLTRRPAPEGTPIEAFDFNFDRPEQLRATLWREPTPSTTPTGCASSGGRLSTPRRSTTPSR
jgi:hypothetical protein